MIGRQKAAAYLVEIGVETNIILNMRREIQIWNPELGDTNILLNAFQQSLTSLLDGLVLCLRFLAVGGRVIDPWITAANVNFGQIGLIHKLFPNHPYAFVAKVGVATKF